MGQRKPKSCCVSRRTHEELVEEKEAVIRQYQARLEQMEKTALETQV